MALLAESNPRSGIPQRQDLRAALTDYILASVPEFDAFEHAGGVRAAANNLRIDAATAEIVRGFERAQVEALLLKGPALSAWYPDEPPRSYFDSDLWVRPGDMDAGSRVLDDLGFVCYLDDSGLAEWWQDHASTWSRDADGVTVDLHRKLQGVGVDPQTAWDELTASTDTVLVAGHWVRILSAPGKALYVTLHAAHHGTDWGKAMSHLERALVAVDETGWRDAALLAERLDANDWFATGLRLTPNGTELADRLGLPATRSVKVALHATTPPAIALGFESLASAETSGARLRIIARKIVPAPGFIRHWWPPAARSRAMLIVGYLYRPVWLLRNAPQGWRAWRAARAEVRGGRRR